MAGLNKKQKALLKQIEDSSKQEPGYLMVDRDSDLDALLSSGQVELNEAIGNEKQVAVRLKSESIQSPNGVVSVMAYEVLKGIPVAPAKRGGKKEEQYPFSKMEIGDSFLVPVTAQYPKPWETFASTVSSATRRFSEKSATETYKTRNGESKPKLIPTRKFTLRRVTEGDNYPNGYTEPATGARVFRIA